MITFAMAHESLDITKFKAEKVGLTRTSLPLVSREFNVSPYYMYIYNMLYITH